MDIIIKLLIIWDGKWKMIKFFVPEVHLLLLLLYVTMYIRNYVMYT